MTVADAESTLIDFISGVAVKATPEEVYAVQVFSQLLVNDYSYPKENIRTRPQWRVKVRPSDVRKELRLKFQVQHPEPERHRMLRWTDKASTSEPRNVA